jgi:hypothetical protein
MKSHLERLCKSVRKFLGSSAFHWQYILSTGRLPAFKPVAVVLAAAPMVANVAIVAPLSTPGFWFIWCGSVTSLLAFFFTWWRCPPFIKDYENFDIYQKKGHTIRWILWTFQRTFADADQVRLTKLLHETVEKGISYRYDAARDSTVYALTPLMEKPPGPDAEVFAPVNENRDLYVPFQLNSRYHVMTIQEDDPKATVKERELFWIICSNLLSSRPYSRLLVWLLYAVTAGFFVAALLINMSKPILGPTEPALSLWGRIAKAILVLLGG